MIRLPKEAREYLAIYTSEYDDTYVLEALVYDDVYALQNAVKSSSEYIIETSFNYDVIDKSAGIYEDSRIMKFRRLNRAIGDNLKLVYSYKCQICGSNIGDSYNAHVVEAHHIDYFIESLNNDQNNLLIVCPNHHSIIHDVNPHFDRNRKLFLYQNGLQEGLKLNYHL
jgi:predicted HNH restriction endonuclease